MNSTFPWKTEKCHVGTLTGKVKRGSNKKTLQGKLKWKYA